MLPMSDNTQLTAETIERLERAEQLKMDGEHMQAIGLLENLLLEDPENVSALEEVADNELSLGHYARSEAAARQCLKIDPESYTAHYIIGFIRSREEKWTEAIVSLRKSNTLKSSNPEILRCLGWAFFCSGQRLKGIVTIERSLNLDAESVLTLCDLGVAYMQLRRFSKSKMLFARALDLEPENLRARECLEAAERFSKMLAAKR